MEKIMKRVITTLAAASLFALGPGMSSPAAASSDSGGNPIVQRCVSSADVFPAETLGNCVALLTTAPRYFSGTGGAGFIAQICSFFMKSRPDDFYAVYDSYNECIVDSATQL
jgi:hypothetical protein